MGKPPHPSRDTAGRVRRIPQLLRVHWEHAAVASKDGSKSVSAGTSSLSSQCQHSEQFAGLLLISAESRAGSFCADWDWIEPHLLPSAL